MNKKVKNERKNMKIGYILSRFPSVFQPWVTEELSQIKKKSYEILIFSLKKPKMNIQHPGLKSLIKHIYYAPFIFSMKGFYAQLYFAKNAPIKYLRVINYVICQYSRDIRNLTKLMISLPKIVHYAYEMKKKGVGHIHAHWATMPATAAIIISELIDIKFSVTCHAIDIFDQTTMLGEKIRKAKFIVTCTKYNKKYLEETFHLNGEEKIFVNYHGKDLNKFKRKNKPPPKSLNLISVGRLSESKGFEYLIEAVKYLKEEKNINVNCVIVGDGPRKKRLEQLIEKDKLEKIITLTGALSHDEIIKHYENSHLFILAMVGNPKNGYPHRGIPNVLAEAMALEIPVITTKLPAIDELVQDGLNGYLVPEKDSMALSDAIMKLSLSKQSRENMGINGRATVEKMYDIKNTIKELIEIFESHI